jgi:hypothetical protein
MKAYVLTTGSLFVLVTLAHVWRMAVEPGMAKEPWYLALTVATAGLAAWAWMLLLRTVRS